MGVYKVEHALLIFIKKSVNKDIPLLKDTLIHALQGVFCLPMQTADVIFLLHLGLVFFHTVQFFVYFL